MDCPYQMQLFSAARSRDLEVTELLLREKKVDPYGTDENGLAVLHILIQNNIKLLDTLRDTEEWLSSDFDTQSPQMTKLQRIQEKMDAYISCNCEDLDCDTYDEDMYRKAQTDYRNELARIKKSELTRKEKENVLDTTRKNLSENEKFINMMLKYKDRYANCKKDMRLLNFQAACTLSCTSWAEILLDRLHNINESASENCPIYPSYTSLHYAAHCNINTVKILVDKGANLLIEDAAGVTPLDICLKYYSTLEVISILNSVAKWKDILFTDGKTKLMEYINDLCTSGDISSYLKDVGRVGVSSLGESLWPGYTSLHLAVTWLQEIEYNKIQRILNSGGAVCSQDCQGFSPIHLAFRKNKLRFVQILFQYHEKALNPSDKDNLTHLHIACAVNDEKIVKKLLSIEANINTAYRGKQVFSMLKFGWTPLHTACSYGHVNVVKLLLKAGADVFYTDDVESHGVFPLCIALAGEHSESLSKLFVPLLWKNQKWQILMEKRIGLTMLHVACFTLDLDEIKKLLAKNVNVNARINKDSPIWPGFTPLHVITSWGADLIQRGNDTRAGVGEILKLLLDKKADVTLSDSNGNTTVHLALNYGYENQARIRASLLMKHHFDFNVNPTNKEGLSHFHIACLVCNLTAIKEFLKCGVDVNQPVNKSASKFAGESPLHLTLHAQAKLLFGAELQFQTVDLLIENDANINAVDTRGWTPLHSVANYSAGRQKFLDQIVRSDTNMNMVTTGQTPFEVLIRSGASIQEIRYFIDHGNLVNGYNHTSNEGYMAIIFSNERYKELSDDIVELLLSSPDIMKVDGRGRNAFYNFITNQKSYLSENKVTFIFERLARLGCNINHQDRSGKTPLHMAVHSNNRKTVKALLTCGADINLADRDGKPPLYYSPKPTEYFHDKMKDKSPTIVLIRHLTKLQAVKLEISQFNRRLLFHVIDNYAVYDGEYGQEADEETDEGIENKNVVVKNTIFDEIESEIDNEDRITHHFNEFELDVYDEINEMNEVKNEIDDDEDEMEEVENEIDDDEDEMDEAENEIDADEDEMDEAENEIDDDEDHKSYNRKSFFEQVEMTKEVKIGERGRTLYDFVFQKDIIKIISLFTVEERNIVSQILESIDYESYSKLRYLLKLQYRKVGERLSSIEPATTSLSNLMKLPLPDLCAEIIFRCLNNVELQNLISATAENEDSKMILA